MERRYALSSLLSPIMMSRASSSFLSSRERFEVSSFRKLLVAKICIHLFSAPFARKLWQILSLVQAGYLSNFMKRGKSSKAEQAHFSRVSTISFAE
jgi:hypothetical protein